MYQSGEYPLSAPPLVDPTEEMEVSTDEQTQEEGKPSIMRPPAFSTHHVAQPPKSIKARGRAAGRKPLSSSSTRRSRSLSRDSSHLGARTEIANFRSDRYRDQPDKATNRAKSRKTSSRRSKNSDRSNTRSRSVPRSLGSTKESTSSSPSWLQRMGAKIARSPLTSLFVSSVNHENTERESGRANKEKRDEKARYTRFATRSPSSSRSSRSPDPNKYDQAFDSPSSRLTRSQRNSRELRVVGSGNRRSRRRSQSWDASYEQRSGSRRSTSTSTKGSSSGNRKPKRGRLSENDRSSSRSRGPSPASRTSLKSHASDVRGTKTPTKAISPIQPKSDRKIIVTQCEIVLSISGFTPLPKGRCYLICAFDNGDFIGYTEKSTTGAFKHSITITERSLSSSHLSPSSSRKDRRQNIR